MNAQESIVWVKEGMQLSLIFLAIRLGLKQVTIEERAELKARAARYEQYRQEMNQK